MNHHHHHHTSIHLPHHCSIYRTFSSITHNVPRFEHTPTKSLVVHAIYQNKNCVRQAALESVRLEELQLELMTKKAASGPTRHHTAHSSLGEIKCCV